MVPNMGSVDFVIRVRWLEVIRVGIRTLTVLKFVRSVMEVHAKFMSGVLESHKS